MSDNAAPVFTAATTVTTATTTFIIIITAANSAVAVAAPHPAVSTVVLMRSLPLLLAYLVIGLSD